MKDYKTNKLRNLALVGHSGAGKTSLTESLLYFTKAINRVGKVADGNTVSDYEKQEIKRKISIQTSIIPVEYKDYKVNFIDAPGFFDFEGEVLNALRASESALFVIDGENGIEVGTEKYWKYTENISLPRIIFVNKLDKENAKFNQVVSDLHIDFSKKIIPLTLTLGEGENFEGLIDVIDKKAFKYVDGKVEEVEIPEIRVEEVNAVYEEIQEVVAESDDELMDKYFSGESFTEEEFKEGFRKAIINGNAVPLVAGSLEKNIGLDLLMDVITKYMPSPDHKAANIGFRVTDDYEEFEVSEDSPFSAVVFKTIADPFLGKISIFKVLSGAIKKDQNFYDISKDKELKASNIFYLRGKEQYKTEKIVAGDIGAFSKQDILQTGDSLCTKDNPIEYKKIKYPRPVLYYAIEAESKNDEDKISAALKKLSEEDPTFEDRRDAETHQEVLAGLGNVQLEVLMDKLKENYSVNTKIVDLKIPYRETIKGKSDVQGKHKKQSGGAGQYGDVFIRFEPCDEEFVFDEEVFGGAVPKNYFPAVEKGLRDSMDEGPLAGYKVVGIKATLYDGSYHPVDSNEQAFKSAARLAFKKGIVEAKPILLEPIMKLEIKVDEKYMGDVMGDMNKRRGKILGMEPQEDGSQIISALAPESEVLKYSIDLRSMTQARGSFSMEFDKYEEVPKEITEKIIEENKKE
ncbi:elongation factor G [Anaerococcus sp. HMSC075B03]|uniref:elongation factor G n=1 Tax=Anaerococcus TaxID=165779 RepID=UPI0008A4BF04|nr:MULTISPECIES: elongation factor G [Anaerococcus]MDU5252764.1 elongation factor G [Anaerococcus vaginalis]MDU5560849.1 elongation factor G [Anaerococcus vaginalis]MDU6782290.1 elongation factor G [Anaerococcus vaginalis]OFO40996.1 elongation factor G [Anaerococcus sp. HMSC075B03]